MIPLGWLPWLRVLAIAALVLVLWGAFQGFKRQQQGIGAQRDRAAWIERDLNAAQDAGRETHRRLQRLEESHRETASDLDAARADADAQRASSGQLRRDLRAATAARRSADPAAVAQCAPAEAAVDLHADLFERADDAAGELAAYADAARIAGEACEREHDALTPSPHR